MAVSWNILGLKPRDELAVWCDEVILRAAGNPEQVQTRRSFRSAPRAHLFAVSKC